MALELNLTKNTNDAIQGTLGKYYARVEYKGTMGLRDLATHMHHHNTAFSKGIITGVLNDMVDCIKELALLGYVVKIDDLGLFKATVESNGLTLEQGAKITAGRGTQRTDEELAANIAVQQFAVGAVKLIMQATGETTIENMNRDASLAFTSKTKAMIKSLTGVESTDGESNGSANQNENQNENGGSGSNTNSTNGTNGENGGTTGGDNTGGDNNGGGGEGPGSSGSMN
jgi:hypothetical protein